MANLIRLTKAEIWWLTRRRIPRGAGVLAFVLVVGVFLGRVVTTNSDVEAAIERAQNEAELAASHGIEIPLEAIYVDPRYHAAAQLPSDIAIASVGIALIFLLAAIVTVGGDWRTGAVKLSFRTASDRATSACARAVTWMAISVLAGFVLLTLMTTALFALGIINGFAGGVSLAVIIAAILRGILVVGAVVACGILLGAAFRSDVAGMVTVVGYLVVFELVLVGLLKPMGYASPASRLFNFINGIFPGSPIPLDCGSVPRCLEVFPQAPLDGGMVAILALTILTVPLVSMLLARRAMWS